MTADPGTEHVSGTPDTPLLSIESLEVRYGALRAVKGVTLKVPESEIVCVLGANGAGKSSLLNAVGGLVPPVAGRVVFAGTDIAGRSPEAIVRRGIALVPEGRRVFAKLTVEENLRLGAATNHDKAAVREDRERVADLFPILAERRDQLAGTLSGGQQQMLAVGRALMCRPRLLLLDEPSMGLAPIMIDQTFELLLRLRGQGITILLVEQNAARALEIADHGCLMATGVAVKSGPARELLASTSIESVYLGLQGAAR